MEKPPPQCCQKTTSIEHTPFCLVYTGIPSSNCMVSKSTQAYAIFIPACWHYHALHYYQFLINHIPSSWAPDSTYSHVHSKQTHRAHRQLCTHMHSVITALKMFVENRLWPDSSFSVRNWGAPSWAQLMTERERSHIGGREFTSIACYR